MNERFVLGIQWHPENLVNRYNEFLGIFKLLVERRRDRKKLFKRKCVDKLKIIKINSNKF